MEMLIKIYDNYRSPTEKFNFLSKEKITIEENLDSFNIATLKANGYDIVEYNKIEIYEVGIPDTMVFKGIVHQPEKHISILKNDTIITCRSEDDIMSNRRAIAARHKVDTVENIVQEFLDDYTSDNFILNIGFSQTISIDYKVGDQYSTILDEIALQCKGYRRIRDGVLYMDTMLGTDKTSGSNIVTLAFTRTQGDNIKQINIIGQSTRANVVIGENSSTRHVSQDLSSGVVYGVAKKRFMGGDLVAKTDAMLERLNKRQRILNIALDPNKDIDAVVGDKLNLQIENVDSLEDISGPVLVTSRTVVYDLARKRVLLHVGDGIIKKDSLGEIILNIKKEVDLL